jgi:hypothetical protein
VCGGGGKRERKGEGREVGTNGGKGVRRDGKRREDGRRRRGRREGKEEKGASSVPRCLPPQERIEPVESNVVMVVVGGEGDKENKGKKEGGCE